jgi:hypothetical protein
MAEVNGGVLLARCLANEGVRFVFGLSSPEIDPFPDTAHACTAGNHVVQALGNTPGIETA